MNSFLFLRNSTGALPHCFAKLGDRTASQSLIFSCLSKRCFESGPRKSSGFAKESSCTFPSGSSWRKLLFKGLCAGTLVYGVYYEYKTGSSRETLATCEKLFGKFWFQQVHADAPDSVPRSQMFNFIADVVENISPGVVFIHVRGR